MIEPIEQIFGEKLYMHQFKINAKAAFTGDVWQWHQDYGTWKRDDGMPEPRAMNIAIFLDEVMPINGPLMLVPKSQHAGDLKASHDLATTSYPLWTLDEETVTRLVKEGGIVAPTGKAGGMLMFHGNLVHGSSGNITPYPRKIVYLTLNAVSNYIRNAHTAGIYRAPRFHADPDGGGRRAAAACACASPGGGVDRGRPIKLVVMAGLVPGHHDPLCGQDWMPGTRPGMTKKDARVRNAIALARIHSP